MSDSSGIMASPRCTVERGKDRRSDRERLMALAAEEEVQKVVVGLPLGLDGRRGRAAHEAQEEAEALAELLEPLGVELEMFDERFTTTTAHRQLAEAGRKGRARRRVVDAAAATVMLQAWLDTHRGGDTHGAATSEQGETSPGGERGRSRG